MNSETKNHYQILGLPWSASSEDIRKAYLIYAAKFHPDKHSGDPFFEERFREVKEAYEILSDPGKRWNYDIRKFGKSKVTLKEGPDAFNPLAKNESEPRTKIKIRMDVSHLDIYLAAFYAINLTGWVIIKATNQKAAPGGYVWGLFLTALSSLLFWLFISGLLARINRKSLRPWFYDVGYLTLGLGLAYVVLWSGWLPYGKT